MEQRKNNQQNDFDNAPSNEKSQSGDRQAPSDNQTGTGNSTTIVSTPNNRRSSDTSTKTGVTGSDYDGQVTP